MSEEKCVKETELLDIKKRVGRLEDNEREDYGARKELSATIKMFAESSEKQSLAAENQSLAIIEIGKTLIKVNENLDTLNQENKEIKGDLSELKQKVNNQVIENIKKTSWDFVDFLKTKAIPFLIGSGIVYAILTLL